VGNADRPKCEKDRHPKHQRRTAVESDDGLYKFVKTFTRPVRRCPRHLLLDSFDFEFCIVFNFSPSPEDPKADGTCDIHIVPLPSQDVLADGVRLVANANRHGVMRFLAALGIQRFDDKTKAAFYEMTNPLRNN